MPFSISAEHKLSDVIAASPRFMLLPEHFGINYPLGDKSIKTVCGENNINQVLFMVFANLYNGMSYSKVETLPFSDAPTIVGFLGNSHRYYLEEMYPNILATITQMAELNDAQEMSLVPKFFVDYFNEVAEHLKYEDSIVFPYVLDLYGQTSKGKTSKNTGKYGVSEYKEHHNDIEEKLADLKNLLIKYLPLKNDQATRRKLLLLLSDLEFDLNIHSQIEDLILIPLVTKMEEHLKSEK